MIRACFGLAAVALLAAGCGGARTGSVAKAPAAGIPPAATALAAPTGYRVVHVWHANLSPGRASLVVSSVGPRIRSLLGLQAHSMDLRVLSREARARRWHVRFDAQKAPTPDDSCAPGWQDAPNCYPSGGYEYLGPDGTASTLLDPKADVSLGPVRFVHLLGAKYDQLVFSAGNDYGGSGMPMVLTVVDFAEDTANPSIEYTWSGQMLRHWRVVDRRLDVAAAYWTGDDPHCCPLRTYHFTVAPREGTFVETSDDRPWLGVTVRGKTVDGPHDRWKVVGIDPYSPARRVLHVGDVLNEVLNAPRRRPDRQPWMGFVDKLDSFRPGQVVRLLIDRHGAKVTVRVKLGSLKNAISDSIPITSRLFDL